MFKIHLKYFQIIYYLFSIQVTFSATLDCLNTVNHEMEKQLPTQLFMNEAEVLLKNSQKNFGHKIHFKGVGKKDVYNITAPFTIKFKGKYVEVIAGRVEARNSEHSKVIFFVKNKESWMPLKDSPILKLQDPFFTFIGNELTFGGVQLVEHEGKIVSYYTSFYKGKSLDELKHFVDGPKGMKDIRLIELPSGKIGVFTRPQGEIGGRGKIGYIQIEKLDELSPEIIKAAPLIENLATQFGSEVWGGVNAAYKLPNGKIGVLGHIAYWSDEGLATGKRHYHSAVFVYDPITNVASNMKLIAVRKSLPKGESKRIDLQDVIFSGGLKENKGAYTLYGGAGDAEGFQLPVANPFK